MLEFKQIDLRTDPNAALFVKDEIVEVAFAAGDGELISREGPNRYHAGDALITGSTGDRWSVSRDRFDAKYQPLPPLPAGADGRYRARPGPVLAKQISQPFPVGRSARGRLPKGRPPHWV